MTIPTGLMAVLILIENPALRVFLDRPFPLFTSPLSIALGVALLVGAILLTRSSEGSDIKTGRWPVFLRTGLPRGIPCARK
ncbi:MAG: hypothetical protein R2912_06410 [Eubacteriales bacterium]